MSHAGKSEAEDVVVLILLFVRQFEYLGFVRNVSLSVKRDVLTSMSKQKQTLAGMRQGKDQAGKYRVRFQLKTA